MKTTSVTDLKNHLSARLKQVVGGESLLVTDRRKPVAIFQPLRGQSSDRRLEGLMAAGLVAPARERLDVDALLRDRRGRCRRPLSEAIGEDREGR
ncbi:MAG: type II toxin-antitoxin system Phd/YefM family antitoxin [Verrucomicrobiales bacterium]